MECIPMSVPKRKKNLYITREAKSLKSKWSHLWKRYSRSQSSSDYPAYTQACYVLRTLTRNLHKQFERQIANNIKEYPKAFWNYARSTMKTHPAIGNIEGIDGKLYTSDEDKSNALNRYFSSVFIHTRILTQHLSFIYVEKSDDVSLSSINITTSIVFDTLVSLKTGKSPGPDGWPVEVLNNVQINYVSPCLFYSLNPWQVVYFQKIGKLVT